MSDREIARFLHITERTVQSHTRNILKKLNAKNRTEAAMKAITTGLV